MDSTQLGGFIVFLLGTILSFFHAVLGIVLLVLGLIIMIGSILLERYKDMKEGDLK